MEIIFTMISSADCATGMGIALTNFMTLAISPDHVSSVHAFAFVLNSVPNRIPKFDALFNFI